MAPGRATADLARIRGCRPILDRESTPVCQGTLRPASLEAQNLDYCYPTSCANTALGLRQAYPLAEVTRKLVGATASAPVAHATANFRDGRCSWPGSLLRPCSATAAAHLRCSTMRSALAAVPRFRCARKRRVRETRQTGLSCSTSAARSRIVSPSDTTEHKFKPPPPVAHATIRTSCRKPETHSPEQSLKTRHHVEKV